MNAEATTPESGVIRIEWAVGHDPDDVDTYAWRVLCDPPISDELVAELLAEVVKVY